MDKCENGPPYGLPSLLCMSTRLGWGRARGLSIWTDLISGWTREKIDPLEHYVCYACLQDLGWGMARGLSDWTDFIQGRTHEKMDPLEHHVCYACLQDLGWGMARGLSDWTDFIQEWTMVRMDRPVDRPVCYACLQDLDGVGCMVCPSGMTSFRHGLVRKWTDPWTALFVMHVYKTWMG